MILLIDNYDSFTFNLRRYLHQVGQEVSVIRNDDPALLDNLAESFCAIVISPGPKTPSAAGHCLAVVERFSGRLPILGICLGHQVIYQAFGGKISRAIRPVHGKSSPMKLEASRIFSEIPPNASFARYHSLIGTTASLPKQLRVTAWCPEGQLMAVEHKKHITFGIQFHPESVLSSYGHQLICNFLRCAGLPVEAGLPKPDTHNINDLSQFEFQQDSNRPGTRLSKAEDDPLPPAVLPGSF